MYNVLCHLPKADKTSDIQVMYNVLCHAYTNRDELLILVSLKTCFKSDIPGKM